MSQGLSASGDHTRHALRAASASSAPDAELRPSERFAMGTTAGLAPGTTRVGRMSNRLFTACAA